MAPNLPTRELNYLEKIVIYGCLGLVVEVFFTAISEPTIILEGHTYLWMVPVWACGLYALEHVGRIMKKYPLRCPWWVRGFVYVIVCFTVEFFWGVFFLLTLKVIPWDYSAADLSVLGAIRLDYFPSAPKNWSTNHTRKRVPPTTEESKNIFSTMLKASNQTSIFRSF